MVNNRGATPVKGAEFVRFLFGVGKETIFLEVYFMGFGGLVGRETGKSKSRE